MCSLPADGQVADLVLDKQILQDVLADATAAFDTVLRRDKYILVAARRAGLLLSNTNGGFDETIDLGLASEPVRVERSGSRRGTPMLDGPLEARRSRGRQTPSVPSTDPWT